MMKILFLDVETTNLTPQKGQIIEVAGIVCNFVSGKFQTVSFFESLVKNKECIDEKILSLTKIRLEDLDNAKEKTEVQTEWLKWLEKQGEINAIIGHSVEFDINFLKFEGWFLPTDKIIDTLPLSKILLGDQQSINLESLNSSLKLDCNVSELKISFSNPITHFNPHRALYDSFVGLNLFNLLYKKANNNIFYKEYKEILSAYFDPIPLLGYLQEDVYLEKSVRVSNSLINNTNKESDQTLKYRLNFNGQKEYYLKGGLFDIFNYYKSTLLPALNSLLNTNYKKNSFNKIILSFINNIQNNYNNLHLHGLKEEQIHRLITTFLIQEITKKHNLKLEEEPALIENITNYQKQILNIELNLLELAYFLEICEESEAIPADIVNPVLNEVDFLNFQIKSQVSNLKFTNSIFISNPTEFNIFKRIKWLRDCIATLKIKQRTGIFLLLQQKLNYFLQIFEIINLQKKLDIENFGEAFIILTPNPRAVKNLKDLETRKYTTYLNKEDLTSFTQLFNLKIDNIKQLNNNTVSYQEKQGSIKNIILNSKNDIFLLGNTRDLEKIENLMEPQNYDNYLMFGLHGGVNKILNKVNNKAKILRARDFTYIENLKTIRHVDNFYILGECKTYLDPFFTNFKLDRVKIKKLNRLKTISLINQIFCLTGKKVFWIENF